MNSSDQNLPAKRWRNLPAGIWALGFGSLFMDASSELIHSVLPIFMVNVLGASMVTVGWLEGIAEATAAIVKVFSGALSDYLRKRKALVIFGYTLAAITKPVFPLATSIHWVFAARFIDRLGKGIRGAPRDALVADIVPPNMRGAAYGLRQALDSVGAFIGPLLAVLLLFWLSNDLRAAMWIAVIPAFFAIAVLVIYVREPEHTHSTQFAKKLSFKDASRLPFNYWRVVILGMLFTLSRFSEAFLILRAQDIGLEMHYVPAVMIVMNIFYAVFAYPAGVAADHMRKRTLMVIGMILLIIADIFLAYASSYWLVFVGACFWGLHMAFTQGLFSKLVADTAPADLLGTGFGIFNLMSGVAMLFASIIAGALWQSLGASATFIAGAGFAFLTVTGLILAPSQSSTPSHP